MRLEAVIIEIAGVDVRFTLNTDKGYHDVDWTVTEKPTEDLRMAVGIYLRGQRGGIIRQLLGEEE